MSNRNVSEIMKHNHDVLYKIKEAYANSKPIASAVTQENGKTVFTIAPCPEAEALWATLLPKEAFESTE